MRFRAKVFPFPKREIHLTRYVQSKKQTVVVFFASLLWSATFGPLVTESFCGAVARTAYAYEVASAELDQPQKIEIPEAINPPLTVGVPARLDHVEQRLNNLFESKKVA